MFTTPREGTKAMRSLTRTVNLALILLTLAAPLVLAYGCNKQAAIETARQGQ
jgi:hypothetical protein